MPTLDPRKLYLGDNGRLTCGSLRCAGMTAHYDRRDLSGQRMVCLMPAGLARLRKMIGREPACETCRKTAEELTRP